MKLLMRGNKQIRVDDVRAVGMLKNGYVEVDEKTGKPLVPAAESPEFEMQKAIEELTAKLADTEERAVVAEKTIEELTAKLADIAPKDKKTKDQ